MSAFMDIVNAFYIIAFGYIDQSSKTSKLAEDMTESTLAADENNILKLAVGERTFIVAPDEGERIVCHDLIQLTNALAKCEGGEILAVQKYYDKYAKQFGVDGLRHDLWSWVGDFHFDGDKLVVECGALMEAIEWRLSYAIRCTRKDNRA